MVLIVVAALLVLGIAYFQVVQGVFSALIMTVLSVLCALVAFNYYESLALSLRGFGMASVYVHPVSLMAIFFVSLLVLRILFDKFFSENAVFGPWIDRIGGGALGIITGMILVGMFTIALQMMPWDASILGYKPYDDSLQSANSLAPFKSDRFVLGMVDFLSGPTGSMSGGGKRFTKVHPDYLLELQANRNRCELPARCDADVDTLTGATLYSVPPDDKGNLPPWLSDTSKSATNQTSDDQKNQTYIVRVNVNDQAQDSDKWYRLPGTHFRLVTESNGGNHFYYPVAFLTYSHPAPTEKRPADEKYDWKAISGETAADSKLSGPGQLVVEREASSGLTIDWVYKIPAGETPQMIIFRNVSKVNLALTPPNQINPPNYAPYDETASKFQKEALKRKSGH